MSSRERDVVLLNLGPGNVGSLVKALGRHGVQPLVTSRAEEVRQARICILPGVGSAVSMKTDFELFRSVLQQRSIEGRANVGICLGAHLMFDWLEESNSAGFELIAGEVIRLQSQGAVNTGWYPLDLDSTAPTSLTHGLHYEACFYFNHGYRMKPENQATPAVQYTIRDSDLIAAWMSEANLAIQFHPEKSQRSGHIFLGNILRQYS